MKQLFPQEVCLKCQGCCRFSQADSVWVPTLTGEDVQEFIKNNIPPALVGADYKIRLEHSSQKDSFVCPLLDLRDNKCRAYAFRPLECRLYPFVLNRKGANIFLSVDLHCLFAQEKKETAEFKEYARYLASLFQSPQYIQILKDNPQIIQEYCEVVDLAELKR